MCKEIPILSVRLIKDQPHCLNLETNAKELRKYSRSLQKGESPGLDRILNEMIKSSFEALKYLYINYSILFSKFEGSGEAWCKDLITPVYRSGDPGNYRPICVLSCLGTF